MHKAIGFVFQLIKTVNVYTFKPSRFGITIVHQKVSYIKDG